MSSRCVRIVRHLAALSLAVAAVAACSSGSSLGSDGDGGAAAAGGARPCAKLPDRDLADNPDGTVLCREPPSKQGQDTTMVICKDGVWKEILRCADSTQTTEGGFVHPCKCADGATGDGARCYYTSTCAGTDVPRGGLVSGGDAGGSGGDAASAADTGSSSTCSTPNSFACGTDSAGVETGCVVSDGGPTLVCCYTLGPAGSKTCGAVSKCVSAGAVNGPSDRCPTGQYQLCKTDGECGPGYHCSGPTEGYCI
jgi:hypothetical protein